MIIRLPLNIVIHRKTKGDKIFALNLNVFRNAHHIVMNNAKHQWVGIVQRSLPELLIMPEPPYHFIYTVNPNTNRKFDLANVLPAVQKFTDDALITLGVIKDDNYRYIRAIDYRFGDIDADMGFIQLEIKPWEESNDKV